MTLDEALTVARRILERGWDQDTPVDEVARALIRLNEIYQTLLNEVRELELPEEGVPI